MKIDMKNMTFTIPVKIEHPDRLKNLNVVLHFLTNTFDTNIIVCEQDTEEAKKLLEKYTFEYIKTSRSDGLIHRTKQLNIMAKHANTPYIANYDADVLANPSQYVEAMRILESKEASFVIPYAGPCWNIWPQHRERIINENSVEFINDPKKYGGLMNNNSVGGVLFWNKEDFIKGGMENENFISWGFEDNERFERFKILDYKLKRTEGILLHLHHHRTPNSNEKHPFYNKNHSIFNKIRQMNKPELLKEISNWKWIK